MTLQSVTNADNLFWLALELFLSTVQFWQSSEKNNIFWTSYSDFGADLNSFRRLVGIRIWPSHIIQFIIQFDRRMKTLIVVISTWLQYISVLCVLNNSIFEAMKSMRTQLITLLLIELRKTITESFAADAITQKMKSNVPAYIKIRESRRN